jgi:peptidoglycan hydrolase-like amidase
MSRLPDKHALFNRSILWSVFLFSIALIVPWVLAESWPKPSQSKTSSSMTPSPQSLSSPQPSSNQLVASQQGHQQLASNSLSGQQSPNLATNTTASPSVDSKATTKTPQLPSPESKTNRPQSQSTDSKTHTSQASKPVAKIQASESSKPNKQQSQSQSAKNSKAKAAQPSHATPDIEIRVAIAKEESSLVVGTSTSAELQDARGKALGKLPANQAFNVVPNGSTIRIGKWETSAGVWVKPAKGGFVFVGANGETPKEPRWYRGDVLLVSQGNTLLAVNYVDLESYIASVVGSEVPASWPMDALKAQAIAARSYALVHYLRPANALYDLGNTQRWQVYGGINSEWNTSRQATEETKGVFLSYKGGVVESMYAANDDIIKKVHGGQGMSQNGALNLAQQGYNYQQILNQYYPGASLAWIDAVQSKKN